MSVLAWTSLIHTQLGTTHCIITCGVYTDQAAAKAARKAKLEARNAWVHEPDAVQADFERDLRKVATQGGT